MYKSSLMYPHRRRRSAPRPRSRSRVRRAKARARARTCAWPSRLPVSRWRLRSRFRTSTTGRDGPSGGSCRLSVSRAAHRCGDSVLYERIIDILFLGLRGWTGWAPYFRLGTGPFARPKTDGAQGRVLALMGSRCRGSLDVGARRTAGTSGRRRRARPGDGRTL